MPHHSIVYRGSNDFTKNERGSKKIVNKQLLVLHSNQKTRRSFYLILKEFNIDKPNSSKTFLFKETITERPFFSVLNNSASTKIFI